MADKALNIDQRYYQKQTEKRGVYNSITIS